VYGVLIFSFIIDHSGLDWCMYVQY